VRNSLARNHESAATFNADASLSQCLTHASEFAGAIGQFDSEILQGVRLLWFSF